MVAALPGVQFEPIRVELFTATVEGVETGLVQPTTEDASVILLPFGYSFSPPWNGQYSS